MSASPATTIMRRHGTGATYAPPMDRRTDAVELLDGPLDDPAALTRATCATCAGSIDGSAGFA